MPETTTLTSEPTIGKVLPEKAFHVSETLLRDYFDGLALDRGAFEGGDAPVPSMVAVSADDYFVESAFSQWRGHLWMRQEWRFTGVLERGGAYTTRARIADIYRKRDRTLVDTEVTIIDDTGRDLVTLHHHQSFLLDAPVDGVEFRAPAKKEGARKFVVPDGKPLDGFDCAISLEMCGQFFHGDQNYHTNEAASKELGFDEVVVGGAMTMSYLGKLLDGHFGARWFDGGAVDVKFTNPVWPNELLHVKGISTGASEDDASREAVFAWIEKDDGTVALIGNASAPA